MAVVTLTSDLGSRDAYCATVRGRLLQLCPQASLVDISHSVEPFNTQQAAFLLRQALPHFPKDSIHWVGVSSQQVRRERNLVVYHNDQFVVGPDDGLFALLFDEHPEFLFAIRPGIGEERGYPGWYADTVYAAGHLAAGEELLRIADQVESLTEKTRLRALEAEDMIRCTVVHVDAFGNVILNVGAEAMERVGRGRAPSIRLRRGDRIERLSLQYQDVEPGERLALLNEAGYLEIAVNLGNASQLLGLREGDMVQIQYS